MRRNTGSFRLGTFVVVALALGCESSVDPRRGASAIVLERGGAQGANVGSVVPVAPVVKVVDGSGNPMAGVRVNFTIASGGGTITGASVNTDDNGLAGLGSWTIGSVGENQLTASVLGVEPLTISAVGRCIAGGTLAIDATAAGNLSSTDCRFANGEFVDRYSFTTVSQRAVRFSQTSVSVNSFLELQGPANVVAFNDDGSATTDNSAFKVLLTPGTYDVHASSFGAAESGAYTVSATAAPENEAGCEIVFAMPGVETVQTLSTDDCTDAEFRYDGLVVYLHAGRTYTFNMTSVAFDTYLELLIYGTQTRVAANDDISSANRNARITFKPTESGFYLLVASNALVAGRGTYTLTIQ